MHKIKKLNFCKILAELGRILAESGRILAELGRIHAELSPKTHAFAPNYWQKWGHGLKIIYKRKAIILTFWKI